jgi:hypothetical protein
MFNEPRSQKWYWITMAAGWGLATVVLAAVTSYHPAYIFPFSLSAVVMAGYAVGRIFEHVAARNAAAAVVWMAGATAVNAPGVVSQYIDGSRYDMRSAAAYVRSQWHPGDRAATFSVATFRYYARDCCEPAFPLDPGVASLPRLRELIEEPRRLWIVVDSTRGGVPPELQRWLFDSTVHRLQIRRKRFDYFEFTTDVFLFVPDAGRRVESSHGNGTDS